jgi:hypothetical protein
MESTFVTLIGLATTGLLGMPDVAFTVMLVAFLAASYPFWERRTKMAPMDWLELTITRSKIHRMGDARRAWMMMRRRTNPKV